MQVILVKENVNLGEKGNVVTVSNGYARNYLFPNGIAKEANKGEVEHQAAIDKQRKKKIAKEKEARAKEVEKIEAQTYEIKAKCGQNSKLFGSVTHTQIAEVITKESGFQIDKRKVQTQDSIKKTGEYKVTVKYFMGLEATIKLNVVGDMVEEAKKEAPAKKKEKKAEKEDAPVSAEAEEAVVEAEVPIEEVKVEAVETEAPEEVKEEKTEAQAEVKEEVKDEVA
jgi:large subunit ribosomal protein L9